MFNRKTENDHLLDVTAAKLVIEKELNKRIKVYEDRLKKPWHERGIEYLTSNYGEAGYKRTKKFLLEMKTISHTKDLINLTTNETYQKGVNLPYILKKAVVEICGFNQNHINLIIKDLQNEIAKDHSRYAQLRSFTINEQAISRIYENIIASKEEYGSTYLNRLNMRLDNFFCVELQKIN